jgi:uncharacterized protein YjbI with pentapeptide repeats
MPDSRIDPLDVGALERSVNDSAGRVSGLWLSFVAFSAYVAAAASMITHRQIFLEEPIKLPTINVDVPLVAAAILMPLLFVIYHVYLLLQVVLLARTAAAYNEALERAVADGGDRTLIRQRLANTLFAQIFAGSPREREGLLGWLLRLMAWITLAVAPALVLIVFEVKFLPYHSMLVTWMHRVLIAVDLLAVLTLWAGAMQPNRDIGWRTLLRDRKSLIAAAIIVLIACCAITIPGEPVRTLARQLASVSFGDQEHADCRAPGFVAALVTDSLSLRGQDFVDDERLGKIAAAAKANQLPPHRSERTRLLRGRDLRCAHFEGADLRRADFSAADLSGASLRGAQLEGSVFSGARIEQAIFDAAGLQGASFSREEDDGAKRHDELLGPAALHGSSFNDAQLQAAVFRGAQLKGTRFLRARLEGADLDGADMQGADFSSARLHGATLKGAQLHAALLVSTQAAGAVFANAQLQAASIGSAHLEGADFSRALVQGVRFDGSRLRLASFADTHVWRSTGVHCDDAQVITPDFTAYVGLEIIRSPRGRRPTTKPIMPEPDAITLYVDRLTQSMPEGAATQLRSRFGERFVAATSGSPPQESERLWSACAEKAATAEDYQEKRAALLIRLVCDTTESSKHVAEGVYRNRHGLLERKGIQLFARGLLGPCPGAKDVDSAVRAALESDAKE